MKSLFTAFCLLSTQVAMAQQWGSDFKESPVTLFDHEDYRLMEETMHRALDTPADSQPIVWENPQTGHRGDIVVLRAFDSRGRECKELQFHNEAQGRKGNEHMNFCRIDGQWKLLGQSQL
ncbi:MAG: hypothetical protein JOZ85_00715 [Betaproteobacteria bacterium]|nr:hypothetical protein [Betaproteobacteria bacterium]